ncbi:MAG: hypothetical protein GYA66_07970 [Phyllobacteriaceae bacterium]|nr:hypothetical protein [Phyllobacteriaceae bacterium]
MNLKKLFTRFLPGFRDHSPPTPEEQELRITTVQEPADDAALAALIAELTSAITAAQAGSFDEYESVGEPGRPCIYLYGPSADRLVEVINPVLRRYPWTDGAELYRAYGNNLDPATQEKITTFHC